MPLKPEHFAFVSAFLKSEAAIVLEPGKEYLVESRLGPVARREGHATLDAFLEVAAKSPARSPVRHMIVDALTTNETLFFRDFHPFEALRTEIIPALLRRRVTVRRLNIWSAASSTGQEAYSIAMLLLEHFPQLAGWDVKILGTDLSTTVVEHARCGSYSQLEVNRGLPAPLLVKYFQSIDDRWIVKPELRKLTEFKPMNLIQPWPIMPPFDLIFLRNVLIYFDPASKKQILKRLKGCLLPHGVLFLGAPETTLTIDPEWEPVTIGKTVAFRCSVGVDGEASRAA
jgi:chemotaxis protein methyltransferase CheR